MGVRFSPLFASAALVALLFAFASGDSVLNDGCYAVLQSGSSRLAYFFCGPLFSFYGRMCYKVLQKGSAFTCKGFAAPLFFHIGKKMAYVWGKMYGVACTGRARACRYVGHGFQAYWYFTYVRSVLRSPYSLVWLYLDFSISIGIEKVWAYLQSSPSEVLTLILEPVKDVFVNLESTLVSWSKLDGDEL